MQRLTGLDAGFLYMEAPSLHMHTLKVAVLEPAPGIDDLPIEWVRAQISARLHLLPPFRRRIVEVPFGFHHPVWIDDPDFDIEYHVRRAQVAPPGGQAEMDAVISEIASRPLDRSRPLWELYVLEGLADGRIGVLVKIHHAAADGVAASQLLANVMGTDADALEPDPPPFVAEPLPSSLRLVSDAFYDHLVQLALLPALLVRTALRLASVVRHRRSASVQPPRPILDTPRTSFNAGLTPHRIFSSGSLPLADVKHVKTAAGVTLNDVVLAVVAGSLRTYLARRGELPDRSLVAGVPVSTDKPDAVARLGGNKVSNLFTSLATDEPDPLARLKAISAVTSEAKVVQNLLGADMMQNWVQYTPPRPYSWFMNLYSRLNLADRHAPPINLVVSNVPGPRQPLFAGGARLVELYSVGPVLEGIGLNITVWSYLDRLYVGVLACRESTPDAARITEGLQPALDELLALVAPIDSLDPARPA
jgi:diacylglycerol O-acyltransferase